MKVVDLNQRIEEDGRRQEKARNENGVRRKKDIRLFFRSIRFSTLILAL